MGLKHGTSGPAYSLGVIDISVDSFLFILFRNLLFLEKGLYSLLGHLGKGMFNISY